MEKNVGKYDRIIRLIGGALLIYFAFISTNRLLVVLASALAGIAIVESYTGFCGFYRMFGINTNKGGR